MHDNKQLLFCSDFCQSGQWILTFARQTYYLVCAFLEKLIRACVCVYVCFSYPSCSTFTWMNNVFMYCKLAVFNVDFFHNVQLIVLHVSIVEYNLRC